jgi:hypothetical protein
MMPCGMHLDDAKLSEGLDAATEMVRLLTEYLRNSQ